MIPESDYDQISIGSYCNSMKNLINNDTEQLKFII